MADQKETEADERDEEESDRDSDDEVESEPAPKVEAKPRGKKQRSAERREATSRAAAPSKPAGGTMASSQAGLLIVLALAVGGAAGWFGQIQQAKAAAQKVDATAPAGSVASGPCRDWEEKVCDGGGKQSAACQQAKGAAELLTPSTCQAGLAAMPATLSKVKAARAGCDKLVKKLCGDLPPGSQACEMVKERTPSFPPKRCDEMMEHYDEVIASLKQLDQQGGMPMGGPGGPGGHGGPGPVVPPH